MWKAQSSRYQGESYMCITGVVKNVIHQTVDSDDLTLEVLMDQNVNDTPPQSISNLSVSWMPGYFHHYIQNVHLGAIKCHLTT